MDVILSNDYLSNFLGEFANHEWPLIIQSLSIYGLYSLSKVIPIGKYKSDELCQYIKENISIPTKNQFNPIMNEINKLKNRISSLDNRIRNIPSSPPDPSPLNNFGSSLNRLPESKENTKIKQNIIQSKEDNKRGVSAPPQRMRFNKEEQEKPILAVRQTSWRKGNDENFDQRRKVIKEKIPSTPVHQSTINSYIYPSWWNDPPFEKENYILNNKPPNIVKEETKVIKEKEDNSLRESQYRNENQIIKKKEPIKMIYNNKELTNKSMNLEPIIFEGKTSNFNKANSQEDEEYKRKPIVHHKVRRKPKNEETRIKLAENFQPYYLRNVQSRIKNQIEVIKNKNRSQNHEKDPRIYYKEYSPKEDMNFQENDMIQQNLSSAKPEGSFRMSNEREAIKEHTQVKAPASETNKKSLVDLANECLSNSIISQFSKEFYQGENTGQFRNDNYNEFIKGKNEQPLVNKEQALYENASIKYGSIDFENERKLKELNANNANPAGIRKTYDAQNIKSLAYQDTLMRNPFNPILPNSTNNEEYNHNQLNTNFNQSITSSEGNPYQYIYVKDEKDINNIRSSVEEAENLSSAEVTSEENFNEENSNINRDNNSYSKNYQINEYRYDNMQKSPEQYVNYS